MLTRIISGVVLAVVAVIAWLAGGFWLDGLVYVAIIAAMYEMASSFQKSGREICPVACVAFVIALPVLLALFNVESILWALGIAMMLAFVIQILQGNINIDKLANTAFVLVYPGCFVALLAAMLKMPGQYSKLGLLLMVAVACVCDIAAYFVGVATGKQKLSPVISPKKTVEGSLGGILGGMLGAIVVCLIAQPILGTEISFWSYLFIGFLGSILGQIGDLAASLVKRAIGIKDYGKIIPGHGGVMDRVDSMLFVVPLIYAVFVVAGVGTGI